MRHLLAHIAKNSKNNKFQKLVEFDCLGERSHLQSQSELYDVR